MENTEINHEMPKETMEPKGKRRWLLPLCLLVAVCAAVFILMPKDREPQKEEDCLFAYGVLPVSRGQSWGLVDKSGNYVLEPIPPMKNILPFSNGMAVYQTETHAAFMDAAGKTVIGEKGDILTAQSFADDGLAVVSSFPSGRYGYIDKTGNYVIEPTMYYITDFSDNGLAAASDGYYSDRMWGYIDKTGTFVIEPQFEEAFYFKNGAAVVINDGKWGAIDKSGAYLIPPVYEEMASFTDNARSAVRKDGLYGYIDLTGDYIVEPVYEKAYSFYFTGKTWLAGVKKDGKWGFIDDKGTVVIPFAYDRIYNFTDAGLTGVMINDKWGVIDDKGKAITAMEFSNIGHIGQNRICFADDKRKIGYMDFKGKVVIPPKFSPHFITDDGLAIGGRFYDDGYAVVKYNMLYGIIDKKGNYVLEPQFNDFSR